MTCTLARASFLSAVFLTLALSGISLRTADSAPNKQQQPPSAPIEQDETIRVDADLVSLSVRVTDERHRPVNTLRREDFRVFEDGAPQSISFFSTEETPVSYGLIVCYSGAERAQIAKIIEAGKAIVNGNRSGDETFIARFMSGERAQIQWNFTSDARSLHDALDALDTGDAPRTLVDALYLSVEHIAQHGIAGAGLVSPPLRSASRTRRRALILVTDGEDRHSFYKQEQLFALLRREDVQVYVIGFVGELKGGHASTPKPSKRAQAVALLNRLATETGGRAFYPNTPRDLPLVAGEIARDLRTQYTIGYIPTNRARDGSFRALRVALDEAANANKRIVHTRSGYVAPR